MLLQAREIRQSSLSFALILQKRLILATINHELILARLERGVRALCSCRKVLD